MEVRGKRLLVVGFARSGRALAELLRLRGARVTVTDSRPASEFAAELPGLLAQKIGVELGVHRASTFLEQDLVVVSPGVPWSLGELQAARRQGIPVVPEVEVASWYLEGTLVGITGTNGKTTTTALVGKMLEASGFPTFVGGNIGVPLVSAVGQVAPGSLVVAELSSFQLEAIQQLRPHVAVLLNLTPNHLDRHGSFADYVAAKAQIFRNQTEDDYAVLNADDANVMGLAPAISSRKVFFSRRQSLPDGVMVEGHDVLYRVRNLERTLFETGDVRLRGEFNLENVLAATAAGCVLGADFEAIRRAVKEFRGVEHRLEYVAEIRGVEFYNDSKATSVDATAKALSAFDHPIHLILGGKDKGAPYAPLRPLVERGVRQIYLIGAAAGRIAEDLAGAASMVGSGDLECAVQQAFAAATPGEVVLLSPACSSYDQFHDFEERGRVFKQSVEALRRASPKAAKQETPARRDRARAPAPDPPPPEPEPETKPDGRPEPLQAVSIYEVAAEELAPLGQGKQWAPFEETLPAQGAGPLESTSDEPLPFEFVAAAARDSAPEQISLGIPGVVPPSAGAGQRRKKSKRETPGAG